jgi:four helix bundle protein
VNSFQELKVWQLGVENALAIYQLTEAFPDRELYGLTSQLRRAGTSIASNIAEGHSRSATKDFIRFLAIARGSVAELTTQIVIARRLGYLTEQQSERITEMLNEESRMLGGLRRSLESKVTQ